MLAEGDKLLGEGTVDEVARHLEITGSTWHRWKNQYGGMKADDAKGLRELRRENQRLKKIVAEQALDLEENLAAADVQLDDEALVALGRFDD